MESHYYHIPKKKKKKKLIKKSSNEGAKADPSDEGRTYGIDCLNLGETTNDSESNSQWILVQSRKGQISYKINKYNSTTH